jgi:hypothetical protein
MSGKMCSSEHKGTTGNQIMFPQLVKIVVLMVLYTELHFSQATTNEVCYNITCLGDIVRSHTDVLNDFPKNQERTDRLENEVRRLKVSLESIKGNPEYQNTEVNLLNDVMELKTVSNNCLRKLNSLDTYQGTTDYLVDDVAQLKGSVEILTNSLSYIESHKEKTDILQNDVISIKESLSNYSCKRDEAAHLKIDILYKNYTLRQNEIEIQSQKVYNLTETQNKSTEKLNKLAISLDQVATEYTMQKKLLDSHTNALHTITTERQIMKKRLEELSNEFQQLLKSQTTPPVIQMVQSVSSQSTPTIPATPPTQQPNSEQHVIRKHAHGRTNINLTV